MSAAADPSVFELSGPDSLQTLRLPATRKSIRRIVIVAPAMDTDAIRALERGINRWYFACGCQEGSVMVLLTLLACVASGIFSGFDGPFV